MLGRMYLAMNGFGIENDGFFVREDFVREDEISLVKVVDFIS